MKTQVIVSGVLSAGLALLVATGVWSGCSSDPVNIDKNGGDGGSDSSSSGGMGGQDAGPNPLQGVCDSVCGHLATIKCTAWPNCSADCLNGFNAPAGCADEVKALLDCWDTNQADFTCSMTQVIPPPACQALETAFNNCFSGGGSSSSGGMDPVCEGQVGSKTDTVCTGKTECDNGATVFKSTCTLPAGGQSWACSCYLGDTLLGTCSATGNICDNHLGCCHPFFALSQQ